LPNEWRSQNRAHEKSPRPKAGEVGELGGMVTALGGVRRFRDRMGGLAGATAAAELFGATLPRDGELCPARCALARRGRRVALGNACAPVGAEPGAIGDRFERRSALLARAIRMDDGILPAMPGAYGAAEAGIEASGPEALTAVIASPLRHRCLAGDVKGRNPL